MAGLRTRWPAVLALMLFVMGAPSVSMAASAEAARTTPSTAEGETVPAAEVLRSVLAELRTLARPPFPEGEREGLRGRLLALQHRLDVAMGPATPDDAVQLIRSAMRRIFDIDLADPAITDRHIARLLELSISEIESASVIAAIAASGRGPGRGKEASVESYWLLGFCFLLVPVPILLSMAVLSRRARRQALAAAPAPSEAEAHKARELERMLTLAKAAPLYRVPRPGAAVR